MISTVTYDTPRFLPFSIPRHDRYPLALEIAPGPPHTYTHAPPHHFWPWLRLRLHSMHTPFSHTIIGIDFGGSAVGQQQHMYLLHLLLSSLLLSPVRSPASFHRHRRRRRHRRPLLFSSFLFVFIFIFIFTVMAFYAKEHCKTHRQQKRAMKSTKKRANRAFRSPGTHQAKCFWMEYQMQRMALVLVAPELEGLKRK